MRWQGVVVCVFQSLETVCCFSIMETRLLSNHSSQQVLRTVTNVSKIKPNLGLFLAKKGRYRSMESIVRPACLNNILTLTMNNNGGAFSGLHSYDPPHHLGYHRLLWGTHIYLRTFSRIIQTSVVRKNVDHSGEKVCKSEGVHREKEKHNICPQASRIITG